MKSSSIILISLLLVSCQNCDQSFLADTSCKPGAPATGDYNGTLPERCDNDIDDNCDGAINEGCDCRDGDAQKCGTDIGECRSNVIVCVDGHWPDCWPRISPVQETCNGLDDDCDGETDNNLQSPTGDICWTGRPVITTDYPATCKMGVFKCMNGQLSCEGQIAPTDEVCDLLDNDCDGLVDNWVTPVTKCGSQTDVGECEFGHWECKRSGEVLCVGAVLPQAEICNGLDDDCDGEVDEDLIRRCENQCGRGIESCSNGQWVDCDAPRPTQEACNGLDDDCDGETDNGLLCVCGIMDVRFCHTNMKRRETGESVYCGRGVQECTIAGQWGDCYFYDTIPEQCNNWDDDCDGIVDGIQLACGEEFGSVGACHSGVKRCTGGEWSVCEGAVGPNTEVCNDIDDDCDGETDEGLTRRGRVDVLFVLDTSGSMCASINSLIHAINSYADDFRGTEHRFALVTFPGIYPPTQIPLPDGTLPTGPDTTMTIRADFTDVDTFRFIVSSTLNCNGGGNEPSYDVLKCIVAQSTDTWCESGAHPLSWRDNAYPYIIFIGDEDGQFWHYSSKSVAITDVAQYTTNCQLGACNRMGDKIEIYMLLTPAFYDDYREIVYGEANRLISIYPAEDARYLEVFRSILANVCHSQ